MAELSPSVTEHVYLGRFANSTIVESKETITECSYAYCKTGSVSCIAY